MVNGRSEWNYYCGTPKNKKTRKRITIRGRRFSVRRMSVRSMSNKGKRAHEWM